MADYQQAATSDYTFRAGNLTIHDTHVVSFEAVEEMSRLFSLTLDLASEDRELPIDQLVGKPAVLKIVNKDEAQARFFNGIVKRFEFAGEGVKKARYHAEVVPWLWLLGFRKKSRIFQDKTAPEIIKQVLQEAGMPSDMTKWATTGSYAKREYCVQYRESELDFIQRLMEEEGIFYYFTHTEESHVAVFGDAPSAHTPIVGVANVLFRLASSMVEGEEYISHFRFGQQVRPGAVVLRDFEFKQPKLNLESIQKAQLDQTLEVYDYPGEYCDPGIGKSLAKVRLEELNAMRKLGSGVGVCRRLMPGQKFTLAEHPRPDFNGEYMLTRVQHVGHQPQVLEAEPKATVPEGPLYESRFDVIPAATPYRPERITPRPTVQGTQTAIVVGPSGEEIYTDEHGRVKVHFHWDREGGFDEKASCWIRCSAGWAGGQYGMFFLPRIGHEVIVDFLEGNPDQPIVVGQVYNGDQKPPYKLPDEKTKVVLRTANSKGQDGANELRFEDSKDNEQIFLHAQKDLHVRVKNDRLTNIERDSHETIDGNDYHKVGGDYGLGIGGNSAVSVGGTASLQVGGKCLNAVTGDYKLSVDGKTLITSGSPLRLEGPGGSITIGSAGIYIVGTMVYINSGDSPVVVADNPASPATPLEADVGSCGKDVSYVITPVKPPPTPIDPLPKKSWIGLILKYEDGSPAIGEPFELMTSDGRVIKGTLDTKGERRIDGIEPGTCQVCFPRRGASEWKRV